MSSAKTIAKNTGFLFTSEIVGRLVSFLLIVAITRYLGDVGLGIYSFTFAYLGLFTILSNFGVNTFMLREVAKDKSKSKKFLDNILSFKATASLIILPIAVISIIFFDKFSDTFIILVLAAVMQLFYIMVSPFQNLFAAHEKMRYMMIINIAERLIAFSSGLFVLYLGFGLKALFSVLILARLIALIIAYLITKTHFLEFNWSFDFKFWRYLIKKSIPFWFTFLFARIYFEIDTVMLSAFKDFAVTGWYNASFRLMIALIFIPQVIISATFPAMSKFHEYSKDLLRLLYKKTFYYLFILGLPIAIGTTLLSERIILFIYKSVFMQSTIILQILIWSVIPLFINEAMGYLLNSINKQKLFTISNGICAALNITLNFILIPKFSFIGAAIATVITQLVNSLMLYRYTFLNGYRLKILNLIYKPVIAGLVMGVSIHYLRQLHVVLIIALASIIYFGLLTIIKGFGKEEINLVRSFMPRKP